MCFSTSRSVLDPSWLVLRPFPCVMGLVCVVCSVVCDVVYSVCVVKSVCVVCSVCVVFFFAVVSCLVLSCLVLSCLVLSCLVLSCLVLSCLVLSCLVLSCLVLSCLVLSCLVAAFSLFVRTQGVGVSHSLLPASLFEHMLMGQARNPPTLGDHSMCIPCSYAHFGRATTACVSSPKRLGCLHWLAHAAGHGHF